MVLHNYESRKGLGPWSSSWLVPTKECQLKPKSQELEPLVLTLQTNTFTTSVDSLIPLVDSLC